MKERLLALLKTFALEHKEVILASGDKSSIYLDCRQVYLRGEAQFLIGELFYDMATELERTGQRFDGCGGMALGSVPLTCALSAAMFKRGREYPGLAVRKDPKDHGLMAKIEGLKGLPPGSRVLIVEDVVTTGGSCLKAVFALREAGFVVDTMLSLVDRGKGQQALLAAGVTLKAAFTLDDFLVPNVYCNESRAP